MYYYYYRRGHPRLAEARPPHPRRFAVRHYAGEVSYDAADFLEANRDAVPDDLLAAFDSRTCEFGFATHLFGAELKVSQTIVKKHYLLLKSYEDLNVLAMILLESSG